MADRAGAPAPTPQPPPTMLGRVLDPVVSVAALSGVATLIVAIGLTWADIVWRRVVGGAFVDIVDINKLCLTAAASFAIPYGFVRGSHVTVDLLAERLPPRARPWLDAAVLLSGAALLALILYLYWFAALQRYAFGDMSQKA
ncbi:MAG TPA: TRAP transporter small permease subunit [Afifellaceae bacterium]|nr:TRAP transporter small permease subunit [Afifellaceae bacterium]